MRHYDQYGRRVPSSRNDVRPSYGLTVFVSLLFLSFITVIVTLLMQWYQLRQTNGQTRSKYTTHDSMTITYTYNGETIRYYVMTDPDTQIQYIVNDRGGMCKREAKEYEEQ